MCKLMSKTKAAVYRTPIDMKFEYKTLLSEYICVAKFYISLMDGWKLG